MKSMTVKKQIEVYIDKTFTAIFKSSSTFHIGDFFEFQLFVKDIEFINFIIEDIKEENEKVKLFCKSYEN